MENNMEQFRQAQDNIIGAMGQSFALYGLADVMGRIYGLLYLADEPKGLDDIASELSVSKATVSINIRFLEEFKFVHKVWQRGSRRDFYVAQRNFSKAILEVIATNLKKELEIVTTAIEKSQSTLATVNTSDLTVREKANFFSERIKELDKQYKNYGRLASYLGMGDRLWKAITFHKE